MVDNDEASFQHHDPLSHVCPEADRTINHHSDLRQHYVTRMEEGDHGELAITLPDTFTVQKVRRYIDSW
jgi:hypothetical protein